MKKIISAISVILLIFYSFVPLSSLIASSMGYSFVLRNYTISAIIVFIVSVIAIVMLLIDKDKEMTWIGRVSALLLLPISFINWLYYILLSEWKFMILCMLICSVCAFLYLIRYGNWKGLKIVIIIIGVLMFIPLSVFSLIDCIFNDFGCNTVVKTIYSSDEKYKAEVIDRDQGSLGGDTLVNVYEVQTGIDLYVLKIAKKPQCVYLGDWGEYQNMEISWIDEHTLIINGVTYAIN